MAWLLFSVKDNGDGCDARYFYFRSFSKNERPYRIQVRMKPIHSCTSQLCFYKLHEAIRTCVTVILIQPTLSHGYSLISRWSWAKRRARWIYSPQQCECSCKAESKMQPSRHTAVLSSGFSSLPIGYHQGSATNTEQDIKTSKPQQWHI